MSAMEHEEHEHEEDAHEQEWQRWQEEHLQPPPAQAAGTTAAATAAATATATILCCECGTPILANPANMCGLCLQQRVDVSEGIPKHLVLAHCRSCGRFLDPPGRWVACALESTDLLQICLKRVRGLGRQVRLVDACFLWSEPHSMRVKVKLTVQKEVFQAAVLQQSFAVEYEIIRQQCDGCNKAAAEITWNSLVQVRQRVAHKRTILFLEQLVLRHEMHRQCVNVKEVSNGLDFFFSHRSHARKFFDFVESVAPVRADISRQLVTHDAKSNTYDFRYTFAAEIAPVCKEDLVCLPAKLNHQLGNSSPLLLVAGISSHLHLRNPFTLQTLSLHAPVYWANAFPALCSRAHLVEYVVLDLTPHHGPNARTGRWALADVQVARAADFGANDTTFFGTTHLGGFLRVGDTALGYDLTTANFNDAHLEALGRRDLPDFVLVRKRFVRRTRAQRHWRLRRLDAEMRDADSRAEEDLELFQREIEEDADIRTQIHLYRVPNTVEIHRTALAQQRAEGPDAAPLVGLEELMEELTLDE